MSLDRLKLQKVREKQGKIEGRCPACAEEGRDKTGNNLVVFDSGQFQCSRNDTPEHRKRIFALAGDGSKKSQRKPIPVAIKVPTYSAEPAVIRRVKKPFENSSPVEIRRAIERFVRAMPLGEQEWVKTPLDEERITVGGTPAVKQS